MDLDRRGRATLPEAGAGESLTIRIRIRGRPKGAPADTANLTLAR